MKVFTDDEMNTLLPTTRDYTLMILMPGPKFGDEGSRAIIWGHGRRNFGLRDGGVLAVSPGTVCPRVRRAAGAKTLCCKMIRGCRCGCTITLAEPHLQIWRLR
jgi:hypothetical protein